MTVLVFLDPAHPGGRIADASTPALLATDQGVTRGDGVFESLLAVNGAPRKVQAHLDRLAGSARSLALEIPDGAAWLRAIATAAAAYTTASPPEPDEHGNTNIVIKLIATRGPEGTDTPTA